MESIAGKVALVTGAGSGIGRATALALAAAGAHVVVADLDAAGAQDTAENVLSRGVRSVAVTVDVGSDDDMARLHDRTMADFGRCDILMHNAGRLSVGPPDAIPIEEWRKVMEVNLFSVVRANNLFLPDMVARGDGHIVITSSFAGLYAYSYDRLPYATSKAALVGIAESLALYLHPRGIGVTLLCPGPVATNIGRTAVSRGAQERRRGPGPDFAKLPAEIVADQVVQAIRTGRFFLPTDAGIHTLLRAKAQDQDAFVAARIADYDRW